MTSREPHIRRRRWRYLGWHCAYCNLVLPRGKDAVSPDGETWLHGPERRGEISECLAGWQAQERLNHDYASIYAPPPPEVVRAKQIERQLAALRQHGNRVW